MNLADLSIRRPIFITCLVIVMIALGLLCMKRLGVDLFPSVTFPVVTVTTAYPGAGPSEIETLVSRPLEEEVSSISGIKRLSSKSSEGISQVVAEFTLETDVKFAEQQIRDRVGSAKRKLPLDIREPVIRRIDPSDQPVVVYSISAEGVGDAQLYDIADEIVRPRLEQVSQVGLVEIIGGRKREIQVQLDRNKLKNREIPVLAVAQRLSNAGENVPVGKSKNASSETVFRSLGEFKTLPDISKTLVSFYGSDVPSTVSDVGKIVDTLEDESSRAYVNGKKSILLFIFRQSGANTIAVVDNVNKAVAKINADFKILYKESASIPELVMIRDTSTWIRANVTDVTESILIGVILAVTVVFLFLTNFRSTIITGLALPNSLIGAFVLMFWAGFSINIMTLLALSLSVGLLIDDAIVVRENIFRHIERGEKPIDAALKGTKEVQLAVVATTLTVLAVFGPVGFLKGVTGQFFREFGLTICFAMLISLFDALTIAPMLSAYFAVSVHKEGEHKQNIIDRVFAPLYRGLNRFHERLEAFYERTLRWILYHPLKALLGSFVIFLGSCATLSVVPKTFLPPQDAGEFAVGIELPSGASLEAMAKVAQEVDQVIRKNPEVRVSSLTVGGRNGSSNVAEFYVSLVPAKQRAKNTTEMKAALREQLVPFAHTKPAVKDYDAVGGGMRPFALSIIGPELKQVEEFSAKVYERLRKHPSLVDVDTSSKEGKPEFQIIPIAERAQNLGILSRSMGEELRAQMEGVVAAKYREKGREYDIRVRLIDEQRDLKTSFQSTYVPNVNGNLVRLVDFSTSQETIGPSTINRMDRGRTVQIAADITPGKGMGEVMADIRKWFESDLKLPAGFKYTFIGQAENFEELGSSMATAMGLGILFIFLVLASLYESFVTPLTIMLALPLALCGSFVALAITQQSLNIFSMIGAIMLLGVATKNSILLVDYANQEVARGVDRTTAMIDAGKTRLRPILMTSLALIAGSIPIALGLNEASRQRTSMGVAIVGGMVSSTLLTLIVIPAAYAYIDRFRVWSLGKMKRLVQGKSAV